MTVPLPAGSPPGPFAAAARAAERAAVAQQAAQGRTTFWAAVVVVVLLAAAATAFVVFQRLRRRRRAELYASAQQGLTLLLIARVPGSRSAAAVDSERAEEVRAAGHEVRDALAELERLSRFETSAAATALRTDATDLARMLEARLRGEGDAYLLDVHITELRERVRGARDRLHAAVGD